MTHAHPHHDLLGGPAPTLLPVPLDAAALRDGGADPVEVVAAFPSYSAGWADLAERALSTDDGPAAAVQGYAYARVGYHRGLDALRRAGWKGYGPVPYSHEGNRGYLRAVAALARAAGRIGEEPEERRCLDLLADGDPAAVTALT